MSLDETDQGEPKTGKNAGFLSKPAPIQIFFRYFSSVGHDVSVDTKNFKIRPLIRKLAKNGKKHPR